jgi:aminopeptidase N
MLWLLAGNLCYAQDDGDDPPTPVSPSEFHRQEADRMRLFFTRHKEQITTTAQSDFDVTYYELFLDFRAYAARTIRGHVTTHARSLSDSLNQVVLDLCSSFAVDSVVCEGTLCPFALANHLLTINLSRTYATGDSLAVCVYYHGIPCQTNSLFTSFLYYDRNVSGTLIPTMATLSEPVGARDWWPSKNDPFDKADSIRVSLVVADTLTATSNGLLEAVTPLAPSSRIFTWVERYPISTYLVCANASNYVSYPDVYVSSSGDSLPIEHFVFPERLARAQTSWNTLPAMMTHVAGLFGEYPFMNEKYGHTMFSYLNVAMEHQTASSFARNLANGQHTYDYIIMHELAHQWYGDDVTMAAWRDVWLNEGFASYAEALWMEHLGGFPAYREYMMNPGELGVTDPSGPVYDPGTLFSTNSVYHKGAWILHMLRGVLRNDSVFFSALREYHTRHAGSTATTADFLQDISSCVGFDVTPYLYNYLFLTNRPHYQYSFGTGLYHGQPRTVVTLRQVQTDPCVLFRNRMDIRLSDWSNTFVATVEATDVEQRFYFDLDFEPTQLTLDPNDWVLKSVSQAPLPITIFSDRIQDGTVGMPYADTLAVLDADGSAPVWSWGEGEMPPGLCLSADGIVSGIPLQAGTFRFRVRVTNDVFTADKWWIDATIHAVPQPPHDLTICQQSEATLRLLWSSTAADSYRVYRGSRADMSDLEWIFTTVDTFAVDSFVPAMGDTSVQRFYQVTSINGPPTP